MIQDERQSRIDLYKREKICLTVCQYPCVHLRGYAAVSVEILSLLFIECELNKDKVIPGRHLDGNLNPALNVTKFQVSVL